MKERLLRRVGRIISGSFNALVDAIENAAPEAVMTEALAEIDGVIFDLRAELGKVVAKQHLARTRLTEEEAKHQDLSSKIALAVNAGRDELERAYRMARTTYSEDSLAVYSIFSEEDSSAIRERIELAYRVLADSDQRRLYDASLGSGVVGEEGIKI